MKRIAPIGVAASALMFVGWIHVPVQANERALTIEVLAPKSPSVFPSLLLVKFVNYNYKMLDLGEVYAASVLSIDGKAAKRSTPYAGGATNLAPGSTWVGCLSFNDYDLKISPGSHQVKLTFGGEESDSTNIKWSESQSPDPLTFDQYFHEIQQMGSLIKTGLPRSCVDMWFPNEDGGEQESSLTRYYIGHQVKVDVPYDLQPTPENEQNVVNGPIKVYYEDRIEN